MFDESGLETQFKRAREEAERLRQEHGAGHATARELYRQLLGFLEKRCPGVYLQLNSKTLYELLRKGSSVVSGETLKEYREKAAQRMFSQPDLPVPLVARESLMDAVAHIWETAYLIAKREIDEVAEVRSQASCEQAEGLRMKLQSLEAELETVRADYARAESDNRLLRQTVEQTTENFLAERVVKERLEQRCDELENAQNRDREAFFKRVEELTEMSNRAWRLVESREDRAGSKSKKQG